MKKRWFIGYKETGERMMFLTALQPTRELYPQFAGVVGPFRTKRGCQFMMDHGQGNPHCRTVAEAEALAIQEAKKEAEKPANAPFFRDLRALMAKHGIAEIVTYSSTGNAVLYDKNGKGLFAFENVRTAGEPLRELIYKY